LLGTMSAELRRGKEGEEAGRKKNEHQYAAIVGGGAFY